MGASRKQTYVNKKIISMKTLICMTGFRQKVIYFWGKIKKAKV
jgi:hypothetical protein